MVDVNIWCCSFELLVFQSKDKAPLFVLLHCLDDIFQIGVEDQAYNLTISVKMLTVCGLTQPSSSSRRRAKYLSSWSKGWLAGSERWRLIFVPTDFVLQIPRPAGCWRRWWRSPASRSGSPSSGPIRSSVDFLWYVFFYLQRSFFCYFSSSFTHREVCDFKEEGEESNDE